MEQKKADANVLKLAEDQKVCWYIFFHQIKLLS